MDLEVKFIDISRENLKIRERCERAFSEILERGTFVGGDYVKRFEERFAQFCGVKYGVGVNSGTDALIISLTHLLSRSGGRKKVITTPFTFFATAEAIKRAGGEVVFCDISDGDLNIDPERVEDIVRVDGDITGILPVHIFGMPADMKRILEISEKYDLWVLEDACQAHGATYRGSVVGSIGDAGAFSFYPTKNLSCFGDGGIVVTDNREMYEDLILLRNHGQVKRYEHRFLGYNSRLDALQAAILDIKLDNLKEYNSHRRKMAGIYGELLGGVGDLRLPESFVEREEVFHLYTVRTKKRNELMVYLKERGIGCGVYYPLPLYKLNPFLMECKRDEFPITERVVREVISLPLYNEIKEEEVVHVAEVVREFYEGI